MRRLSLPLAIVATAACGETPAPAAPPEAPGVAPVTSSPAASPVKPAPAAPATQAIPPAPVEPAPKAAAPEPEPASAPEPAGGEPAGDEVAPAPAEVPSIAVELPIPEVVLPKMPKGPVDPKRLQRPAYRGLDWVALAAACDTPEKLASGACAMLVFHGFVAVGADSGYALTGHSYPVCDPDKRKPPTLVRVRGDGSIEATDAVSLAYAPGRDNAVRPDPVLPLLRAATFSAPKGLIALAAESGDDVPRLSTDLVALATPWDGWFLQSVFKGGRSTVRLISPKNKVVGDIHQVEGVASIDAVEITPDGRHMLITLLVLGTGYCGLDSVAHVAYPLPALDK